MTKQKHITVGDFNLGNNLPFALIAGPCAIESLQHALETAASLVEITKKRRIPFIYKSSFDKANRTSSKSGRGVGLNNGLSILSEVQSTFGCPVITDIHTNDHCIAVSEVVDILQIPAFLCRQTDLIVAAARTGLPVNIKKGQFMAPWDMKHVVQKMEEAGNYKSMLCERGASFGYNALVSDLRSLPQLAETGCPVVYDATHSVQQPGGQGATSGGERKFVPFLARAAVAVGVAAVFIETHQDPDKAPSDGPNMLALKDMPNLLDELSQLDQLAKVFNGGA